MSFALDHPADPFSAEYRTFQMRLYEHVARRHYHTAHEASVVDVDAATIKPFPYSSGNSVTAGQHLGAIAVLLRTMRLRPGARILEFGSGWGNTTLALAQLGFDVTAVDVEARFCELIRRRAARAAVAVNVVNADFFWAETVTDPFDAVVFFECFHHCADHMRLLRALHGAVKPDGHVYFGAEPVLEEYPVPWGLRMDGEALWAIRNFGWLELGFREAYFREALNRAGWLGMKHVSADLPWVTVWEAAKYLHGSQRFDATDPRLGTLTGTRAGTAIQIVNSKAGYGLFGPYMPLGPGRWRGTLHLQPGAPLEGSFILDACADQGRTIFGASPVDVAAARRLGRMEFEFVVGCFPEEAELRLFCHDGATAHVAALEFTSLGP